MLEKDELGTQQTNIINVSFQSSKSRKKELCVDNKVRETIGDVYCPTCRNEKCVYISNNKANSFYDCNKCKICCNVLNIILRTKNRHLCYFVVTVNIVSQKRWFATTKKKNHLHFWRNFSANHNQTHLNLNQKGLKWAKHEKTYPFVLVEDLSDIIILQIIFFIFNLQSTAQI